MARGAESNPGPKYITELDSIFACKIPGYTYDSKSRKSEKGDNTGVYISNKHNFFRRENLESDEMESVCIKLQIKNSKNTFKVLSATCYH